MIKEKGRYGVLPPQTGYSYEIIGKALGLNPRRVKVIEQQALYKIRMLGGDILGDFLEDIGVNLMKKKKAVIKNDLSLIDQKIQWRLISFRQICSNPKHARFNEFGGSGIKCNIAPIEFKEFILGEMRKMKMNTEDYTEFSRAFKFIRIKRIDKSKDFVLENLKIVIKGEK